MYHFNFFLSKPILPPHGHENYVAVSFVQKAGKCPIGKGQVLCKEI